VADLVSGWLCLEFANTVDNYRRPEPSDFLHDFDSLVDFCNRTDALSRSDAEAQRESAKRQPSGAAACLDRAKALRRTIYAIFSALAGGEAPPEAAFEALNDLHAEAAGHARILRSGAQFEWGWDSSGAKADRLLWPLVRSAALLLTSPELKRLRQCDGHNCTWLFLDKSKNRSRRWCTMDICGNRAKSRRHYARTRIS
jgi:predicted RNA-binding Zn ribbon-like protein